MYVNPPHLKENIPGLISVMIDFDEGVFLLLWVFFLNDTIFVFTGNKRGKSTPTQRQHLIAFKAAIR